MSSDKATGIVNDWENTAHSSENHDAARNDLIRRITTALSAAKQQGRDEQRERDAQIAETVATREDVVRAIRSNQ